MDVHILIFESVASGEIYNLLVHAKQHDFKLKCQPECARVVKFWKYTICLLLLLKCHLGSNRLLQVCNSEVLTRRIKAIVFFHIHFQCRLCQLEVAGSKTFRPTYSRVYLSESYAKKDTEEEGLEEL